MKCQQGSVRFAGSSWRISLFLCLSLCHPSLHTLDNQVLHGCDRWGWSDWHQLWVIWMSHLSHLIRRWHGRGNEATVAKREGWACRKIVSTYFIRVFFFLLSKLSTSCDFYVLFLYYMHSTRWPQSPSGSALKEINKIEDILQHIFRLLQKLQVQLTLFVSISRFGLQWMSRAPLMHTHSAGRDNTKCCSSKNSKNKRETFEMEMKIYHQSV